MLLHSCNYLTGASFFISSLLPSPTFENAKHIEEIYTVYSRSEHVLLVKLKGQDNREDFQIFWRRGEEGARKESIEKEKE